MEHLIRELTQVGGKIPNDTLMALIFIMASIFVIIYLTIIL